MISIFLILLTSTTPCTGKSISDGVNSATGQPHLRGAELGSYPKLATLFRIVAHLCRCQREVASGIASSKVTFVLILLLKVTLLDDLFRHRRT